ncbi:MAG: cytochrome c oxidase assembly protein [Pseudomonadota bacterium]
MTPTDKNRRTLAVVGLVVLLMLGLSFASVPLYNLFCRVTGLGGTTQMGSVADAAAGPIIDREISVRFNADVNRDMPWTFKADQRSVTVRPGEQKLVSYRAKNPTSRAVVGTAIYNVTPPKVGKYFHKIQCFCFQDQVLSAGKDMHMPVLFYIDPKLADDPEMADVSTITLSYTFFRAESHEYQRALEAYGNTAPAP